jgi:plasmid stabilization system protein ParE
MPLPVRFSESTAARLERMRDWYNDIFGPPKGDEFYHAILDNCEYIQDFNHAAPAVPGREGLRCLVVTGEFPYYIFYEVLETEIVVFAVTKEDRPPGED